MPVVQKIAGDEQAQMRHLKPTQFIPTQLHFINRNAMPKIRFQKDGMGRIGKISDSNRFSTRHVRLETYLHFLIELINGVTLRGKAIALRLAQDGFDICINDIEPNTTGVDEVVKEIQNLGRKAYGHIADVTSTDNVNTMVSQSVENLGPLNVMVANAGIAQVKPVLDLTEDDVRKMFDVNFFGVYKSYAAAARQFIKQGGGGKIIGAASASKWAVRGLTQAMAMEMAPHGITVNAYAPGIVGTAMWDLIDEEIGKLKGVPKGQTIQKYSSDLISLGRTSVPEDPAKVVSFLASDDSDYMTGQTLVIDGGIVFT
ncbi:MAG: hypothetical protein Q9188_006917 [Gyalolechia gomerana]